VSSKPVYFQVCFALLLF
jgi:hypothetical protein